MSFWIFVVILALVSIAFLYVVFWSKTTGQENYIEDRIARNVQLYKQRLAKFDQELVDGFINEEEYQQLKEELGLQLLKDVEAFENLPETEVQPGKLRYLLILAPVIAILLYIPLGAYQDWLIAKELRQLNNSPSQEVYQERFKNLVDLMEQRLESRPENLDYRILLARVAMNQEDFEAAAIHYGVLVELLPEDEEALAYYTQAEFLRNGGKIDAVVASYMDRVLKLNPHNQTILGIQGVVAMEEGDYALAAEAWSKLLAILPPESEQAEYIRQGLEVAKSHLGEDHQDSAISSGITVKVSLDESLYHLDSNLLVFIYAKAASGPPMPLAVERVSLRNLPIQVKLDDSKAMMEQMRLSNFEEIKVGARVSMSGQPVASPGDWQTETGPIIWRDKESVELVIKDKL